MADDNLAVMSVGFMLQKKTDAIIWRGQFGHGTGLELGRVKRDWVIRDVIAFRGGSTDVKDKASVSVEGKEFVT
eukprot:328241-Amorphochlora_amoeboformis.AAC.1